MKPTLALLFVCVSLYCFTQDSDLSSVEKRIDSLIQVSRDWTAQKDYEKAIAVNDQAEKLTLEHFGEESAPYGSICYNRGRVLGKKGVNDESEHWYLKAKLAWEKAYYTQHKDYTSCLRNLGIMYTNQGKYAEAEKYLKECIEIRGEVFGKESQEYASGVVSLAILYSQFGNLDAAEPLWEESRSIKERELGNESEEYADVLFNLATFYRVRYDFEKAANYLDQAKRIRENLPDKNLVKQSSILRELGALNTTIGNYAKAEAHFLESKSILEKLSTEEDERYAAIQLNLGYLYEKMGLFEESEQCLLQAKNVREKLYGKESLEYAKILSLLSVVSWRLKKNVEAERYALDALSIIEKKVGKENARYCGSLVNLAIHYKAVGNLEKAESLYLEAKRIFETKIQNPEHPDYPTCLTNLGVLYLETNRFQQAELLLLKAIAIREKIYGKSHESYAKSLNNLSVLYWQKKDYEQSGKYLLEENEIEKTLLVNATRHLSEQELSNRLGHYARQQNQKLSFAQQYPGFSGTAFNNTLFYKGFLLDASEQTLVKTLKDSISNTKYNKLKGYRRQLAVQYAKPLANRTRITELEEKANLLEKELIRTVSGFGDNRREVSWADVQAALQNGEAAVEFVHYNYYTPLATDSIFYAALVIKKGMNSPTFITLFEEKELMQLIDSQTASAQTGPDDLYRGLKAKKDTDLNKLYATVWELLESQLQEINTIYYAPSGLLHRINLEAITTPDSSKMNEKYNFRLLNSTRSLVLPSNTNPEDNTAVLFGGIHYDAADILTESQTHDSQSSNQGLGRSFRSLTTDFREEKFWAALPGTTLETSRISEMLSQKGYKVSLTQGDLATEEAFKEIGEDRPSPRVLHIATHGFFFPDPVDSLKRNLLDNREAIFKTSDNPMIRSGLVLAGANHTWSGEEPYEGMEDGILTAYEISQMNLRNTELVVLSACETGLGDIKGNEGVYGLQRAFKMAGAKYLVMSLWEVPDRETQTFMTQFYQEWLSGKTIHQALRDTKDMMKKTFKDSIFWAAFVLVE